MIYFRAWYRRDKDGGARDADYPDWIVLALDEDEARGMVLKSIGRREPERGFTILLTPIADEDEGTGAFASARQNGQALM